MRVSKEAAGCPVTGREAAYSRALARASARETVPFRLDFGELQAGCKRGCRAANLAFSIACMWHRGAPS